jgi:hypothetical protein
LTIENKPRYAMFDWKEFPFSIITTRNLIKAGIFSGRISINKLAKRYSKKVTVFP